MWVLQLSFDHTFGLIPLNINRLTMLETLVLVLVLESIK